MDGMREKREVCYREGVEIPQENYEMIVGNNYHGASTFVDLTIPGQPGLAVALALGDLFPPHPAITPFDG